MPNPSVPHHLFQHTFHTPHHTEADLIVPSSRKNPFQKTHPTPPQPSAPPRYAPTNITNNPVQAPSSSETVDRLSALVTYYQSKYPHEQQKDVDEFIQNFGRKENGKSTWIEPVLKGYEEQIRELQATTEALQKTLKNAEEAVLENEKLRDENRTLRDHNTILEEENKILLEEKKRNMPILEKAFEMDRDLSSLRTRNLIAMQEALDTIESKYQALLRWKRKADMKLEEFEQCCEEIVSDTQEPWVAEVLACLDRVPDPETNEMMAPEGILLPLVRRMKREYLGSVKKQRTVTTLYQSLSKTHTSLLHRYQLDLAKSDTSVRVVKDHLNELMQTMDSVRSERDEAVAEAEQQVRDNAMMTEKFRDYMRKTQVEVDEHLKRHRQELQILQDKWDVEREKMLKEVQQLRKEKVDLQCEIGILLREKRVGDVELGEALRSLDLKRDQFKKEVLGL